MKRSKLFRIVSILFLSLSLLIIVSCETEGIDNKQSTSKQVLDKIELSSKDGELTIARDINSLKEDISLTLNKEITEIVKTEFLCDKDGNNLAYVFFNTPEYKNENILFVSRKVKNLILPSTVVIGGETKERPKPVKISCEDCSPCRVFYNPDSGDVHCESECCIMHVYS